MAKKPKKTKAPKPTNVADTNSPAKAKKPRKAKTAVPAEPEVSRTVVMHGETRLVHADEAGALALASLTPLIDAVHAQSRVRITSASHSAGISALHAVLPDHPTTYDTHPGIILTIDSDNLVSFDHVIIGYAGDALVEDAIYSLLNAVKGDDEHPATVAGRRADWFEQACLTAETVGSRHA